MSEQPTSYSIALRLRRVTFEDAFVAVPVTDAIMIDQSDGTSKIDVDAFIAAALKLGADPRADWKIESQAIESHPIQSPCPPGRTTVDAYYDHANQRE